MRIARVFPRRTKATPDDPLAFTGFPGLFPPEVDRVHVSVAFTWDLERAERLEKEWRRVAPVDVGGPALGDVGQEFLPGRYLRRGYTITSRGCPRRCWFCSVWKRDGDIRQLPIRPGWHIQDDNLLACTEDHIRSVFTMLATQPKRPCFCGGLEARFLEDWHVDLLAESKPQQMFFAYDTPDDWEPLVEAARKLGGRFSRHQLRCYVLIGAPRDTLEDATKRLESTLALGFFPFAMLWRRNNGDHRGIDWRRLQKAWSRPASIYAMQRLRSK